MGLIQTVAAGVKAAQLMEIAPILKAGQQTETVGTALLLELET